MKTAVCAAAVGLCLLLAVPTFAEDAPAASMTAEERAELVQMLDDTMDDLLGLIRGLSEEQWTWKENEDRWSVGECTEHIVRSEAALLQYAQDALKGEPDPEWQERTKGKSDFLKQVMPNRGPRGQGGAQAPMEIRPTEKWDRQKAIEEFYKVRGQVQAFVETTDLPLKQHTLEHPFPIFGWLNAYDWTLYVPLHTVRHSRQIIEVKETEGFPES
ncbi:MAG: DinB family protein [Candidatus Hydrogenedentales bacterium]